MNHEPQPFFYLHTEFGGALLAPELTDEKDRNKITGSLFYLEAESIDEVRKIVESDIYYTSGVVRLAFPSSTIQSISSFDFDLVEQGAYLYPTFHTGDALAVELEGTATAGTFGVIHMLVPLVCPVLYLMTIVPSNVKSFVRNATRSYIYRP